MKYFLMILFSSTVFAAKAQTPDFDLFKTDSLKSAVAGQKAVELLPIIIQADKIILFPGDHMPCFYPDCKNISFMPVDLAPESRSYIPNGRKEKH